MIANQVMEVMEFRMESKTCLIRLLEKMLEKCPASYSLRHLSKSSQDGLKQGSLFSKIQESPEIAS